MAVLRGLFSLQENDVFSCTRGNVGGHPRRHETGVITDAKFTDARP